MTDAPHRPRINALLRQARERAGLSLDEAAKGLGISKASMSRMETGVSSVPVERIEALAAMYGIDIAGLFEGAVVTRPSATDLSRLREVVLLVQQVIADLDARPSPEKVAEATLQLYRRETDRIAAEPHAPEFPSARHRPDVETVFKK